MLPSLKLEFLPTPTPPFLHLFARKKRRGIWQHLFKCKTGSMKAQSSDGQSWIRIVVLSFDRVLGDAGEQ